MVIDNQTRIFIDLNMMKDNIQEPVQEKCPCLCCVHLDEKCSCDCNECANHKGEKPQDIINSK